MSEISEIKRGVPPDIVAAISGKGMVSTYHTNAEKLRYTHEGIILYFLRIFN